MEARCEEVGVKEPLGEKFSNLKGFMDHKLSEDGSNLVMEVNESEIRNKIKEIKRELGPRTDGIPMQVWKWNRMWIM